jgi:hypothetical protein
MCSNKFHHNESRTPYIVQIAYPSSCDVKLLVTAFTVSHLLV